MKRILCWLGAHDWGRQKNIRDADTTAAALFFPFYFLMMLDHPKDCDRTCLRCGKTKTFPYDRDR